MENEGFEIEARVGVYEIYASRVAVVPSGESLVILPFARDPKFTITVSFALQEDGFVTLSMNEDNAGYPSIEVNRPKFLHGTETAQPTYVPFAEDDTHTFCLNLVLGTAETGEAYAAIVHYVLARKAK